MFNKKSSYKLILAVFILIFGISWYAEVAGAFAVIDLDIAKSPNISSTGVSRDKYAIPSVEVSHKKRGIFLALWPVSYIVRAEAWPDGRVRVEYPWYTFLTIDDREQVETKMEIAVTNALRSYMLGSVWAEGGKAKRSFSSAEASLVSEEMRKALESEEVGVD